MQVTLFNGKTTTAISDCFSSGGALADRTYQATVKGTGAVSATVVIEASNEGVNGNFLTLGTITLSGTTVATDGFASQAAWGFVRANITAISGTGAAVTVTVGA